MGKRCFLPPLIVVIGIAICWLTIFSSVAGETRIEVDEHGDEYELKRFYIQGRQLNGQGSKSQCVVTRRKRASRALAAPAAVPASVSVSSQQLSLSPAVEGVALPVNMEAGQLNSGKRRYVALAAVQLHNQDDDDDDDDEQEDDDDDVDEDEDAADNEERQQAAQGHSAQLPQGVSVVASAATAANVGGEAGIVVVESQQPPKVNPSTHAVFELKPLAPQPQQQQQQLAYWPLHEAEAEAVPLDEDDYDEDDLFYYGDRYQHVGLFEEQEQFITEESPVSTEAIWSTDGDDDIHPVINQANQRPTENKKKRKQQQQQQLNRRKQNKRRKQQQQQQKKKRRPVQDAQLAGEDQQQIKRKKEQQQDQSVANNDKQQQQSSSVAATVAGTPNKKQQKKRNKKKKKNSSSVNKRRRPSSSSSSSSSSSLGGYRRRRPQLTDAQWQRQQQKQQQRRRRLKQQQQQKRRRQEQQRRRRRRNKNRQQQGNRMDYFGDEPIINCIYINKDPVTTTTTTARPFWNILGRDASSVSDGDDAKDTQHPARHDVETEKALLQAIRRNGDFGQRKRANLKFVA